MCAVGMTQYARITEKDDPGEVQSRDETEAGGEKGAGGERAGSRQMQPGPGVRKAREEAAAGEQARAGGGALESLSQGRKGMEWSRGLGPRTPECC